MWIEWGHFALVLALAVSLVQSAVPIVGVARRDERLMAVGSSAALTARKMLALTPRVPRFVEYPVSAGE